MDSNKIPDVGIGIASGASGYYPQPMFLVHDARTGAWPLRPATQQQVVWVGPWQPPMIHGDRWVMTIEPTAMTPDVQAMAARLGAVEGKALFVEIENRALRVLITDLRDMLERSLAKPTSLSREDIEEWLAR